MRRWGDRVSAEVSGRVLISVFRPVRPPGGRGRADGGRGGGEPAGDQPDAERQLERSTGDGADECGALDAGQLQQVARGEACVADEAPGSQPTRHERGAEEQSAEEEASDT